jgi:hypothetical protein
MQKSLEAMQVAVRVLTALSEKRTPDPADVEILNNYAPLLSHLSPDELACDVIQQALRRREQVRARMIRD